ncbi:MAG: carbon storage regulator CsrA [Deltaproteobacteria bacterium]|nr:carbon storage regulator CsrA [Deltaproteobacteria bacterium]MBN2674729.1 carbon storage regulator CsrA [Deltaproteobacteria bacterium]
MLVLSRKKGESIVIGNDIVVTVKEIRGRNVRLAIDTPRNIPVNRMEIHMEIMEENKRAAEAARDQLESRLSIGKLSIQKNPTSDGEKK